MAGKFLQIWSLRSVAKTMAVLVIIAIAVAIYATREIPDNFADNKEWEFWRNLDFAVCVVSLAFASVLLYGSITEFRMFIFAWMIWNVILIVFWIVFLARKKNELEEWERTFRFVAIFLMAFAEIPVFSYFRYLRVKYKDPESNFSWIEAQSDKVYTTLGERPSFSSIDAMFGKTPGRKNPGFQSDSARNSTISVASEEIEENGKKEGGKVDEEDRKEIMEKENENEKVEEKEGGNEGEQEESDVQSQSSFEISVVVHTTKPAENTATEVEAEAAESAAQLGETSSSYRESEEDKTTEITVTVETDENQIQNQIISSMDIAEDEKANEMGSAATDSSVVVDMEGVGRPSHLESSVAVETDVTDMESEDVNQTSF